MQCTLLIPHLAPRADLLDAPGGGPDLPNLQLLMSRGRHRAFPPLAWEAWLCQAFEVERQRDWPVAPLTLAADGGDPEESYWLRADPVHMRIHRNQLVLSDTSGFAVSLEEARALVESMNAHFKPEGLRFSAPHANRWYLRVDNDPGVSTTALDDAAGDLIDRHLPAGPNALAWRRILNETQMLLHAHAINEAREARGEPAINGVWFWGGGRRTAVPGRHFTAVVSNEALGLALAAHADVTASPLPRNAVQWLAARSEHGAHRLVVPDALTASARRGDAVAWRRALEALDADWIGPLIQALKAGRLAEVALVAPAPLACHRFELRRRDLLRFWRMPRPPARWLEEPSRV
ncbi:MAG TPA: hypothetical protein VFY80_00380 [Burkholderiales bacterium]|nr:hypothetical protein [Burkholderiales bacterium]